MRSKSLAALRELPIYTLRDVSNKKPIAALPFDNQGHINGVAVALLPKNDWRACLSYNNQVLQGWAMVLDAQRQCVCFADYRNKGRTRLLCLCAGGIPVAVQIWRGKESVAFLIELADGQPVAHDQKHLSPEQAERLAAALAELASIEGSIRDCERDWKAQLTEWWTKHDNALRTIAALPIDERAKQARKIAYYKKLFDEQHAGLDKLLIQFGYDSCRPGGSRAVIDSSRPADAGGLAAVEPANLRRFGGVTLWHASLYFDRRIATATLEIDGSKNTTTPGSDGFCHERSTTGKTRRAGRVPEERHPGDPECGQRRHPAQSERQANHQETFWPIRPITWTIRILARSPRRCSTPGRRPESREPISYRTWGESGIDAESHVQMRQACALPMATGAALMPDAHVGYGLPIGGVLALEMPWCPMPWASTSPAA